ncbi:Zn-ribbon domain-containing OB-fold protein [Williamsia sp. DF01-3]|uniref:Zn-ribbon domain-containing OB-fold protein n=1 Tax=Williamsia sp. DF01-3 TaxID=2934157 RepID=UPI001FF1B993|nr:OB-fold domain-containing protein [Williamsia sp. DF01-3]MCK0517378.1 OB-fold domain-containing protein [Williamsia sp. DF01-3]
MTRQPIAENLFVEDGDEVRLLVSTSSTSPHLVFPAEPGRDVISLNTEGRLYTWTSQEFRPPAPPYIGPEQFTRFGVGYVDFPEGVRVEGRLTTCDPAELAIGQRMRTVVIPFGEAVTFAFEPVEDSNQARSTR